MKIEEKFNDIKFRGAKMKTVDRPTNLSPFLNHFGLSLIIGLPASGKSSLIKNLLMGTKQDNLYNLPDDKMISLADEPLEQI